MSSTPIYDELAALLLVDEPVSAEPTTAKPAERPADPTPPVRTGGRRRKPDADS
ncbi:hypothetical protein GCM10022243_20670 [Saccharothrix violaceirubra]|uniref:Uncharacterized protein n=1 Tax=Saccharothrix violaceirubra TaxID=413306 RepID=A0A7W7WV77_9PSEU|nr:hypothetical protein [Saccharothrix violaceirubra]MBB4965029.1 hypothetical protein [Saccharothrix violaceirubra]